MSQPILKGSRTQCSACGEFFSSVATFDRHRTGDFAGVGGTNRRRCLTAGEMTAEGWPKTATGFWLRPRPSAVHYVSAGDSSAAAAQLLRQEEGGP